MNLGFADRVGNREGLTRSCLPSGGPVQSGRITFLPVPALRAFTTEGTVTFSLLNFPFLARSPTPSESLHPSLSLIFSFPPCFPLFLPPCHPPILRACLPLAILARSLAPTLLACLLSSLRHSVPLSRSLPPSLPPSISDLPTVLHTCTCPRLVRARTPARARTQARISGGKEVE